VGDESTTYNISLDCPSGLTCSPTSVASNSIDGNTLENNAFTITVDTTGSYTITATVSGNSQTLNTSKDLTVSSASATTTTPGGGGGGGGTTGNVTHKKSQTWTKVTPGAATIMKITDPEIGLKIINITVVNPAQTVTITVTKLDGKPATVVHEIVGKVYKYIDIDAKNINETHIDKVKIQFEVNKSWINANNIDPDTVALNRYKNGWEKLSTRKTSEDNDYYYYEAETPGFSTFAISGEVKTETTTIPGVTTTIPSTITTILTTTIPIMGAEMGMPVWSIVLIIIIIVAVIGFWLYKKRLVIK